MLRTSKDRELLVPVGATLKVVGKRVQLLKLTATASRAVVNLRFRSKQRLRICTNQSLRLSRSFKTEILH